MEKQKNYRRTLIACYIGFITQAICSNFAPLLFMTFHKSYGISFGNLAIISTVFYITQLLVDLLCVNIVDKIGYRTCVVVAEATSGIGLIGLAVLTTLFNTPFVGIIISVVIYAIGSGLTEVLVSPIVEACPFENKDKVMSLLHSFYCWGAAGVIIGSTIFFALFGIENWKYLVLIWSAIPIYNIYNFVSCPIEKLVEDEERMTTVELIKNHYFWLFILLMVCAGASEAVMAQWGSAYVESALHVSKAIGDLAGPCGFAICMGISRGLYGKYGEKVDLTIFMAASGILCLICYTIAGFVKIPILGLLGCELCGCAVGIMWPGSISISSRILCKGGTAMFALLALAGDLGAAIGPMIVGNITQTMGDNLQKGILASIGFPIVLVICVIAVRKRYKIG